MNELDQLVKMANQIAANFSFHGDGVQRLAEHLQKFWAPVMQTQLQDYVAAGGDGVDDMVRKALKKIEST